jgi:uncharacterized protein (TIGR00369 family)
MDDAARTMQKRVEGLFPSLLGVRFVEVTPTRVVAELVVRDELCTVPGILHGGAIMSLADTMGAVGTVLNLPQGAGTTTIESKTNFLGAARTGTTIAAVCTPVHLGKQTMVWRTEVKDGDRTLAVVTQTQMVLQPNRSPVEQLTSLFADKTPEEQKTLLATLERGGAAVYRALAANETDAAAKDALLLAAEREEQNAEVLEQQIRP